MILTLSGSPLSTQHLYGQRGRVRYMKKEAKTLKEQYQWEVKKQWKRKPLTGDVEIQVHLFFKDKRRRDWDNWHKLSQDALEGIVYEDDCQIQEATVRKFIDRENPRIEIEIIGE